MVTTPLNPGDVLNGRYVVRRLIANGRSTDIYEAEDLSLQRPVAIKTLGYEILANEEWRAYFRHQVTAVAALHHPNLLRIYDWGEENGRTYVVTEFLAGGSLRDVLRARTTLSREQTAMIGLEAATALAYAHARGFIHGALRPSKILFDDEGRVRVSDLGVTAALASAVPGPASLETARYESPEQVLGETLDGRSDVYSLSLMLYQCLTGEVPHDALTPAAARTNRIGAPLPHRSELGPLDLVLALGAAPEASARPEASLFASRLEAIAMTLPLPRPVTLGPDNTGGFKVPSPVEVLSAPAVAVPLRANTDDNEDVVRPFDLPGYRDSVEAAVAAPVARSTSRSSGSRALLIVIIALVLGIGGVIAWRVGVFTPSYKVPSLLGLRVSDASKVVASDNFSITIVAQTASDTVPSGHIVSQQPVAGASLKQGGTIKVVVSRGRATVNVPNVLGMGCKTATAALVAQGLSASCPGSAAVSSATFKRGAVVATFYGQVKNPVSVPKGSALVLSISTGTATSTTTTTVPGATTTTTTTVAGQVSVPNFVGMTRSQALAAASNAGLYIATYGPGSNDGTWTSVVAQTPAPGTAVKKLSTVKVTVKK